MSVPAPHTRLGLPTPLPRPHAGVTSMGAETSGGWRLGKNRGPAAARLSEANSAASHRDGRKLHWGSVETRTERNLSGTSPATCAERKPETQDRPGPIKNVNTKTKGTRSSRQTTKENDNIPPLFLIQVLIKANMGVVEHERKINTANRIKHCARRRDSAIGWGCHRFSCCSGSARQGRTRMCRYWGKSQNHERL